MINNLFSSYFPQYSQPSMFQDYNAGYNPFGQLGFQQMGQGALGALGISDPNVMSFRTPTFDQPIHPFGMDPLPVYGYDLHQERLNPPTDPTTGGPGPVVRDTPRNIPASAGLLGQLFSRDQLRTLERNPRPEWWGGSTMDWLDDIWWNGGGG